MKIDREVAEKAFMSFSLSPGINFKLNDSVTITGGEYKSASGAVITISDIEPEITYNIELGNGSGDVIVPQRLLRPID